MKNRKFIHRNGIHSRRLETHHRGQRAIHRREFRRQCCDSKVFVEFRSRFDRRAAAIRRRVATTLGAPRRARLVWHADFSQSRRQVAASAQLSWIATHGGLVAAKWKKAITAVLCVDSTLVDAAHRDALSKAVAAGVPLVHLNAIDDVVAGAPWAGVLAKRTLGDAFARVLAAEAAAASSASSTTVAAVTSSSSSVSSSTKRKTPTSSVSTTTTTTTSTTASLKKSTTVSTSVSIDVRPLLQKSTVFDGVVRYSDGDDYAFELQIEEANASTGVYVGTATWKKLEGAETEWSIKLSAAGAFEARENKASNPSAAQYVAIGAVYTGMLSDKGDLLMGNVVDADGAALSPSFRLTHKANLGTLGASPAAAAATTTTTTTATAMDEDENDDGADVGGAATTVAIPSTRTFEGVATLRLPFTVTVDGSVAKLDWKLGGSIGEAVEIVGDRFVLRKAKGRAPSLALPSEFEGKISGDIVSGTVENGTFEMHAKP
jgi:hypothetical protein